MRWKYYNHAMIPDCPPHVEADVAAINDGSIWKIGEHPLLARWTSDFDCGYETEWWYTIKDSQYDIQSLKAKRRYEITKARRNFIVKVINPLEYAEELYSVQVAAFSAYPAKYRPTVNHDLFIENVKKRKDTIFGAFWTGEENSGLRGKFCGYSAVGVNGKCIEYRVHKAIPEYEKNAVNFALVDGVLKYYEDNLANGCYISNGQRSTNHETAFNDLLERYFGFRKAYCKLQIVYRPGLGWLIKILYCFRNLLKRFDDIRIVHLVNAVLTMEEIRRKCNEDK